MLKEAKDVSYHGQHSYGIRPKNRKCIHVIYGTRFRLIKAGIITLFIILPSDVPPLLLHCYLGEVQRQSVVREQQSIHEVVTWLELGTCMKMDSTTNSDGWRHTNQHILQPESRCKIILTSY